MSDQNKGLIEKLEFVASNDFVRLSYTEAIEILRNCKPNKKKKFKYLINEWGADLQSEHERYLVEKHFKAPVVLFDYPANIKAFYMRLNEDEKNCFAPWTFCSQASARLSAVHNVKSDTMSSSKKSQMSVSLKEELWWYLETRKFGTCVHSGFGLGFERLVLFATGMGNIRDVIPVPTYAKERQLLNDLPPPTYVKANPITKTSTEAESSTDSANEVGAAPDAKSGSTHQTGVGRKSSA